MITVVDCPPSSTTSLTWYSPPQINSSSSAFSPERTQLGTAGKAPSILIMNRGLSDFPAVPYHHAAYRLSETPQSGMTILARVQCIQDLTVLRLGFQPSSGEPARVQPNRDVPFIGRPVFGRSDSVQQDSCVLEDLGVRCSILFLLRYEVRLEVMRNSWSSTLAAPRSGVEPMFRLTLPRTAGYRQVGYRILIHPNLLCGVFHRVSRWP